ncbi:MAG: HNH endonuclease [Bacteroidales bacterium]|nr:HNH endonuclease [Bacteroidales bacterium]
MEKTGHCIICHEDNKILSDEHVIPEAIGGYYHIFNICRDCNSKLGDLVDIHLINHWFIKASRHLNGLKGYSKTVPHPLVGDGVLEDGHKVRMEVDKNGTLTPHLLPSSPSVSKDGSVIHFQLDEKDENLIPKIEAKIYKKYGIDPSKHHIEKSRTASQVEHPKVEMHFSIDLKNYKIGLLKIAYEFAVDKIEGYYNDTLAFTYSDILSKGATDRLNEIYFEGDSIKNSRLALFNQFIDNSNINRHIIVLFNNDNKLYCLVKIFDDFCQLIKMADKPYGKEGLIVIAINDPSKHDCRFYTDKQLLESTIDGEETTFTFDDKSNLIVEKEKNTPNVGFSCDKNNDNILYDINFKPICTEGQLLVYLEEENMVNTEQSYNDGFSVSYNIPAGYYYMLMPGKHLLRANTVTKITKIKKL